MLFFHDTTVTLPENRSGPRIGSARLPVYIFDDAIHRRRHRAPKRRKGRAVTLAPLTWELRVAARHKLSFIKVPECKLQAGIIIADAGNDGKYGPLSTIVDEQRIHSQRTGERRKTYGRGWRSGGAGGPRRSASAICGLSHIIRNSHCHCSLANLKNCRQRRRRHHRGSRRALMGPR